MWPDSKDMTAPILATTEVDLLPFSNNLLSKGKLLPTQGIRTLLSALLWMSPVGSVTSVLANKYNSASTCKDAKKMTAQQI